MKAVIVDIKNNFVSVLTDDGCVVKMKNNNYEIGQVIQIADPNNRIVRKMAGFAASAAAVLVIALGTWAYTSPYSYVSLDVNPSIEYTVNRFDRVLSVKAVNDDGEEILEEIILDNLKNKTIQDALTKTVEQITEAGYFEGTEGGIVITTSAKNNERAEELARDLEQSVEKVITESGNIVAVEASSIGMDRVKEAQELGATPGKLNLVEKLIESSADPDSINVDEWLDKSVKDIMKATKENKASSNNTAGGNAPATDNDRTEASEKEQDAQVKADDKADKAQEKADEKTDKAQEKADDKADKAQEKAEDKADQAQEKADDKTGKTQEKAEDKAGKTQEKAEDKAGKTQEKAGDKADKAQEKADDKPDKTEDTTKPEDENDDQVTAEETSEDKVNKKADKAQEKAEDKEAKDEAKENAKKDADDSKKNSDNGNGEMSESPEDDIGDISTTEDTYKTDKEDRNNSDQAGSHADNENNNSNQDTDKEAKDNKDKDNKDKD